MAVARALTQTAFDEYLPLETDALAKHELVSGYIHAMGGASDRHEIIVMNLAAHLHMRLRKGPCVVMAGDMKVNADEHNGYYPDIGVYCDPGDNQALYRNHPTVIVEVLSASTAGLDKTTKRFYYQRIDTLGEYVLIEQDKFAIAVDRRIGNAWDTGASANKTDAAARTAIGGGVLRWRGWIYRRSCAHGDRGRRQPPEPSESSAASIRS